MAERLSFEDQISKNKAKSFILMLVIFFFIIGLGMLISQVVDPGLFYVFTIFATIFSIVYVWAGYYFSDKIALSSINAKPASQTQHRMLFNAVKNMSLASGLPMPKVYVMDSKEINAFASGRSPEHAVICVTSGALEKLNKQELEGVIAHEMSHIANFDIRFMTLTAVLVGILSIIAQMFLRSLWFGSGDREKGKGNAILMIVAIVAAILAPIAAQLVQLAISRKREYGADATGVKFTRYPKGLRDALIKIKNEHIPQEETRRYNKAVAPLFISDPFKKKVQNLFSTHPDINDRIKKLDAM